MHKIVLFLRAMLFMLGMLVITPIFALLVILMFPFKNITRSRVSSY